MEFKFIVTMDNSRVLIVETDIDKSIVKFRGERTSPAPTPHLSEFHCEICRTSNTCGKTLGACKAVGNIFELCKHFSQTKSIDQIDMTMIHNNKCISHSTRKADDALVEMIFVIIAASGCSNFSRIRWGWNYWNYESELHNLFYNLFSSFLVLECMIGDSTKPLEKAIENSYQKINKVQLLIHSIIDHIRNDFSFNGADAAPNALAAIWAIGDMFKLHTDKMLDQLKERIMATQPRTPPCPDEQGTS